MNKKVLLKQEAEKIEKCSLCQKGKIGKAVSGEGSPDAQIVFIGEAPVVKNHKLADHSLEDQDNF